MHPLNRYSYDVPPGFEGLPLTYLATLFSLIMISLLALEWMWRIVWGTIERPHSIKHPITVLRFILFCVSLQVVLRVGPDVVRFAMWKDLSPIARYWAYQADHILDMVSFVPFSMAWMAGYLSIDLLYYQLDRRPLPMHLWPTFQQMKRPLKIGVGVFLISAAIVYLG